jgi:hypothetical protein
MIATSFSSNNNNDNYKNQARARLLSIAASRLANAREVRDNALENILDAWRRDHSVDTVAARARVQSAFAKTKLRIVDEQVRELAKIEKMTPAEAAKAAKAAVKAKAVKQQEEAVARERAQRYKARYGTAWGMLAMADAVKEHDHDD